MGAPYDLVSACDLERLCEKEYKLIIFLDQFLKTEKSGKVIEKLRRQKKTLLFLYACDITDKSGNFDISLMNNSLGMTLFKNSQEEDTIVLNGNKTSKTKWKFDCFAIKERENITVLGRYEESGKAAYGYMENDGAVTAFSGLGMLNGDALAPVLKLAGVHRYAENADVAVYPSSAVLGVYHRQEKDACIYVNESDSVFTDLFSNNEYISKDGKLFLPYGNNRAKLLMKKHF